MKLSLSFDNGPFPEVTPGVLDALARADAKATFFVVGRDAQDPARRPLLEAIHAAGHRIGNHTWSHRVELGTTSDAGLVENTAYNYTVSAIDNAMPSNESAQSGAVSRSTPGCPPSVPADVTATATSCTSITVSWNASTDTGGSGLAATGCTGMARS